MIPGSITMYIQHKCMQHFTAPVKHVLLRWFCEE